MPNNNRKKLFNHLKTEMKEDRAKHKILPPSKFGLIQITRQRVRPEMNIKTREENPSNGLDNEVEAPIVLIDKISEDIDRLVNKGEIHINLNTHPFIAAYLEKGYPSVRLKWYFKHKKWVKIILETPINIWSTIFWMKMVKLFKKNPINY